jgi:hypothetical protein
MTLGITGAVIGAAGAIAGGAAAGKDDAPFCGEGVAMNSSNAAAGLQQAGLATAAAAAAPSSGSDHAT